MSNYYQIVRQMQEAIKKLQLFILDFSPSNNKQGDQHQQMHSYIQKIFLEDQEFDGQSWFKIVYDHLVSVGNNDTYETIKIAEENFANLIESCIPSEKTYLEQQKNIFKVVFGHYDRGNQYKYSFDYKYWPKHLQTITFGRGISLMQKDEDYQFQQYLAIFKQRLAANTQDFQSGKLTLDLEEYYWLSFIKGLSKLESKNRQQIELSNVTKNQLFEGLTHNPFLILLQQYLQYQKFSKDIQQLQFFLFEYLIVERISYFKPNNYNQFEFDYTGELQILISEEGANSIFKNNYQQQQFLGQGNGRNSNINGGNHFNLNYSSINQANNLQNNSFLGNNSVIQQQSAIFNNNSSNLAKSSIQGQQQQQKQQEQIIIPQYTFDTPQPHVIQALQLILYYNPNDAYKSHRVRRQIYKFLYCILSDIQSFKQQSLTNINDLSKLYLQYLYPQFEYFTCSIKNSEIFINNWLQKLSKNKNFNSIAYISNIVSKIQGTQQMLGDNLNSKFPFENESILPFNWEQGDQNIENQIFQKQESQNQIHQYTREFNNYIYQQQIDNNLQSQHLIANTLFYTILFNKFIVLYGEQSQSCMQDHYGIMKILQFFRMKKSEKYGNININNSNRSISNQQNNQEYEYFRWYRNDPQYQFGILKEYNFLRNEEEIKMYCDVFKNINTIQHFEKIIKLQINFYEIQKQWPSLSSVQNSKEFKIVVQYVENILKHYAEPFYTQIKLSTQQNIQQQQIPTESYIPLQQKSDQKAIINTNTWYNYDTWDLPCQPYEVQILYWIFFTVAMQWANYRKLQLKQVKDDKDKNRLVPNNWGGLRKFAKFDLWYFIGCIFLVVFIIFYIYNALFSKTSYNYGPQHGQRQQSITDRYRKNNNQQYDY